MAINPKVLENSGVLDYLRSGLQQQVQEYLINVTIEKSLADYEAEIRPLVTKAVEQITLDRLSQVLKDYGNAIEIGVNVKILGDES